MDFRKFLLEDAQTESDLKRTLSRLPKIHQELVKPYKFKFLPDSTLKNDKDHVGLIDEKKKTITVAAPWNYGRGFTVLHEVAHLIWKYLVIEAKRKDWSKIVEKTKDKMKDNDEELFCMAYASFYCDQPVSIHDHPEWDDFIKKLPK